MQPDVIIIDTDSPTRDTLEQLSFVNARQPRPIVLFTEDRDNATIQAALKAGVSAYVVAGMQPDRLQPILDVAVARFEQERALRDELKSAQDASGRAQGDRAREGHRDEAEGRRRRRGVPRDAQARDGSQSHASLDVAQQIIDVTDLLGMTTCARAVRWCARRLRCTRDGAPQHRSLTPTRRAMRMKNIDESMLYRLRSLMAWISLKRKRR